MSCKSKAVGERVLQDALRIGVGGEFWGSGTEDFVYFGRIALSENPGLLSTVGVPSCFSCWVLLAPQLCPRDDP